MYKLDKYKSDATISLAWRRSRKPAPPSVYGQVIESGDDRAGIFMNIWSNLIEAWSEKNRIQHVTENWCGVHGQILQRDGTCSVIWTNALCFAWQYARDSMTTISLLATCVRTNDNYHITNFHMNPNLSLSSTSCNFWILNQFQFFVSRLLRKIK